MTDEQKTKEFLASEEYMVLAVTLDDGTPWVTPIRIQLQWGNAFEWDSKLDTEHSKAIERRPTVAITLFSKNDDAQFGFCAHAKAKLIDTPKPGFGRYQAIVTKAWINDETFIKRQIKLDNDA